ncbi:MAG: type II secretion system protein [Fimbriimonas sp.]
MTKMLRLCKGFTVVEILVVLAIICTLAAIIFPVFVNARKEGGKSTCTSNLRQLGLAMQMYRESYAGVDSPGTTYQMGIPPSFGPEQIAMVMGGAKASYYGLFRCTSSQSFPVGQAVDYNSYQALFPTGLPPHFPVDESKQADWIAAVTALGGQTPLFIDPNHQRSWPVSGYTTQFAIAVTLDGSVIQNTHRGGSALDYKWWLKN